MSFGVLKSLVLYLILSGIVLNFSPNSNYKRYIRFFLGLLILILLAEPIQFIFHMSSGDLERFVAQMEAELQQNRANASHDTMYNYYEMGLSESIRQTVCEQGIHVAKVEVLTDNQNEIVKCTIRVTEPDDSFQEETIKKIVSDVYNLELNRIYIVRR